MKISRHYSSNCSFVCTNCHRTLRSLIYSVRYYASAQWHKCCQRWYSSMPLTHSFVRASYCNAARLNTTPPKTPNPDDGCAERCDHKTTFCWRKGAGYPGWAPSPPLNQHEPEAPTPRSPRLLFSRPLPVFHVPLFFGLGSEPTLS